MGTELNYDIWIPWVSRLAIILNFLSFWLVAPEFIGEERLQKIERKLKSGFVFALPTTIWLLVLPCVTLGALFLFLFLLFAVLAVFFHYPSLRVDGPFLDALVAVFTVLAVIFANRSRRWADQKIAKPLLAKLVNDDDARRRYLVTGILMFILGHALQFLITFRPT
jgi:hypothetical protein